MTVRSLLSVAAAVGLGLASSAFAEPQSKQPAPTKSAGNSQKLAEEVASRIGNSGVAYGANVTVNVKAGMVELKGEIRSVKQGQMIVQQALTVPGVIEVKTLLALMTDDNIQPVQAAEPMPALGPMAPAPAPGVLGGVPQDPMPLAAPGTPGFDMGGPKMPPHAWPTYAPFNNFSRVAYPQAYPYSSFPFIGPYYPFPKVPPGWRSVKLEWDDGHWYLGRLSTPHDYWRVRFW